MAKDTRDIGLVTEVLHGLGITVERITESMYPRSGKLPDLRCEFGDGGFFFVEVKSPFLAEAEGGGYAHSTTMSKLSELLSKAAKQFKSVNTLHIVPNVLVWVSRNFQLNWTNLVEASKGQIGNDNVIIRDLRQTDFVKRNRSAWFTVDIHIWLQVGEQGIYQAKLFRLQGIEGTAVNLIRLLEANIPSELL